MPAICDFVACLVMCRAATCAISCAIAAASSSSSSAILISAVYTKTYPPGSANAFGELPSITWNVNGTLASELRTRFCPIRLMYSEISGSSTTLACRRTSSASCLPSAISFSSE